MPAQIQSGTKHSMDLRGETNTGRKLNTPTWRLDFCESAPRNLGVPDGVEPCYPNESGMMATRNSNKLQERERTDGILRSSQKHLNCVLDVDLNFRSSKPFLAPARRHCRFTAVFSYLVG